MIRTVAAALGVAILGGAAGAQGFSGAELSAETLAYAEDSDFGQTTFRGSAEFEVGGGFGIAADLGYVGFRNLDLDATNLTLHLLWDGWAQGSVGGFVARDEVDGGEAMIYGAEAGTSLGAGSAEGYVGFVDGDGEDGMTFGFDARYELAGGLSATASGAMLRTEGDGDAGRVAIGAEYRLSAGPALYGEVGKIGVDDEDATYVGLGARIALGPNDGTTFGPRGLFEVLSGF